MKWALAFSLAFGGRSPQLAPDRWIALDKWKHFVACAVIESVGYGFARGTNGHSASLRIGAAGVVVIGVAKEVRDLRVNSHFSRKDLVWDGLGGATAAAVLHAVR